MGSRATPRGWALEKQGQSDPQPFHVQLTEIDSIELYTAGKRIIKALYEEDDSGLSRTRGTDEGAGLHG